MLNRHRILIIENDPVILKLLRNIAQNLEKLDVTTAVTGEAALELIREQPPFDIVMSELEIPNAAIDVLLPVIREKSINTLVTVISSYGNHGKTITALRLGIYGFVLKPFREEEVRLLFSNMSERLFLVKQVHELTANVSKLQAALLEKNKANKELLRRLKELEPQENQEKKPEKDLRTAIDAAANKKISTITRYDVFSNLSELSRLKEEKVLSEEEFQNLRRAALEKAYKAMVGNKS